MPHLPRLAFPASLRWSGLLLGLSLGGFFDGILLHQVLQWHHLLSAVQSPLLDDPRMQIAADGLFHALMYLVAALGLYLLWRARLAYSQPGADRALWGNALLGFGTWHVLDAVLSHWVLGIHRVRMDSANPLFWDLLWLVIFGVAPLAAGWWTRRRSGAAQAGGRRGAAALALAVVVAGPVALAGPGSSRQVMVVLRPDVTPAQAFNMFAALDARVVWSDAAGAVWALQLPQPVASSVFYRRGALLVSSTPFALGCFSWSRAG